MDIEYDGVSLDGCYEKLKWWTIMFTLSNIPIDEKATEKCKTCSPDGQFTEARGDKEGIILNPAEGIREES